MTPQRSRYALLLLAALLPLACGKKSAPTEAPAPDPNPAPQPQAKPEVRAKLIGKWERAAVADTYPIWMEFRKDGTATIKHQMLDGIQTTEGTFTAPEYATGLGPYSVEMKVPNGGYGWRVDFKDNDLLMYKGTSNDTLTFRKAK